MAASLSFSQNTIGARKKRSGPKRAGDVIDESGQRQDAVAADEPLRLHGEGDEGSEVDEPQQPQEQEGDEIVARRLVVLAPQEKAHAVEGWAVRGGERVSPFRDGRESRHMLVEREPESLAARVAQGQEARLCGAGAIAVRRDVLHRALKLGLRDLGILRRDLLVRPVFDAVAGELLPIARPINAEAAIAVIDQQRPRTGGRLFAADAG